MEHDTNFNGKTVLVFGGCGFIGSNFVRRIVKEHPDARVVVFDKLTYSGNLDNLKDIYGFLTVHILDVADPLDVDHIFEEEEPDYVINFAAETHVDRSIHVGAKEFIDTNVTGVFNILEACKKYGVKKYVQVSTDEVYGQLRNPHDISDEEEEGMKVAVFDRLKKEEIYITPREHIITMEKFREDSPFKPNVPYSATKAAGDCLCNAYFHTWQVPVVVTHCSNNYGPYQYPEKLVPYWATRVLAGLPIPVYGDGLNIRDWIHVDDHIDALVLCLLSGEPGETYNIGADNERTNMEMADIIAEVLTPGEKPALEFVKDRPGHDRRYAIDHSKISRELGWRPKYGRSEFLSKLKETLEWYRDNAEWAANIIKKTGVANPHIDLWKGTMKEEDLKEKHE